MNDVHTAKGHRGKSSRRSRATVGDMLTKEEHDKWFEAVFGILRDCRITVNNWAALQKLEDKHDLEFVNHGFVRHIIQHYWFTLITQLNKLLVQHQDNETSFQAIFNRYLSDTLDPHYLARLDANLPHRKFWYGMYMWGSVDEMKDGIKKQNARLFDPEVKDAIKKVDDWRRKATAHTDLDKPSVGAPSFEELVKLTNLADEIFRMIRAGFGYSDEDTLIYGLEVGLVRRMWRDGHLFHKLERWVYTEHKLELRAFIDRLPD